MSPSQKICIVLNLAFFLGFIGLMQESSGRESSRYLWPIDYKGKISGNFAECRWDHFHGGIDIETNGSVGYKVFAIDDGYIWRVKTSAAGYGKAIYLKLTDGRYVVYAHMSKFIRPVQKYVTQNQKELGTYEVDLSPPEDMFPVSRGDVIGYSGKSGDVDPHLHIELRNEKEEPINLLTHGLYLPEPDTTYPSINHLAVQPFSPYSMADEQYEQLIYLTEKANQSGYTLSEPISAWGIIGLKADVSDTDAQGEYHLAVYKLRLIVDNKTLFSIVMDRISYEYDYYRNFFLYDRELKYGVSEAFSGDYLRLFALPKIDLSVCPADKIENGYLLCGNPEYADKPNYIPPGEHTVTVEVSDAEGNVSNLDFVLRVEHPRIFQKKYTAPPAQTSKKIKITPHLKLYDSFFSIVVNTDVPPADIPVSELSFSGTSLKPVQTLVLSDTCFEYVYLPCSKMEGTYKLKITAQVNKNKSVEHTSHIPLYYVSETGGGTFVSHDALFHLSVSSNNQAFMPRSEIVSIDPSTYKLKKLSSMYQLKPVGFQLSNPAVVKIKIENTSVENSDFAVFEWMGEHWRLLRKIPSEDPTVAEAYIDHLSTFAVFADDTPPRIKFVKPARKTDVIAPHTMIVCRVKDDGVGIAYKTIAMSINGKRVPAEYIYDGNKFVYTLDDPLPQGKNKLEVFVEDRLGNSIKKSMWFIYKNKD